MDIHEIQRHLQIDVTNLNKEVHLLKKQNQQLQKWVNELQQIVGHNVSEGNLLSIVTCQVCDGTGNIWEKDSCRCCDDPVCCLKCKGKGEHWGYLCG